MISELYKRYRPKTLDEVVGQDAAVKELKGYFERGEVPHCILISGPSGTGKTTIGRILRRMLECSKMDYHEKDCASEIKPLEFVRELKRSTQLYPMKGKVSVWFLEEVQSLSRAGFSQQAMLKLIEDCPKHVYFILATTDPDKLNKAIHSRATRIKLGPVKAPQMKQLLESVIGAEKMEVADKVVQGIIEAAEGGARKALVILAAVGRVKGEKKQLDALANADYTKELAYQLGVALIWGKKSWNQVAQILQDVSEEDPEGLRYMILSMARNQLIGKDGKPPQKWILPRAYAVIDIFSGHFYDSKHAGLAAACYEVLHPE